MMKKFSLVLPLLLLTSCVVNSNPQVSKAKFGVFLGADSNSVSTLTSYQNVCIDLDEFTNNDISFLKKNSVDIYAYLSIGSIESYRSYYEDYKEYAFMDYDNWPDEKWIDISKGEWKTHLYNEATRFKNLGASGLFMDNFDVYYIASEVYEGDDISAEAIYRASIDIISYFHSIDLKLIINGASTLLEELHDRNKTQVLNYIDVYCQETVFSSIIDYENDIFGVQDEEETEYCLSVISFMKKYSSILLLEYATDRELINYISSYCSIHNFYYYISSHVNLI